MRVLQLIDSLDAGGAERMAVSIANGLCEQINHSFLCATRKEGILKDSILPEVGYLFLNRSKTLDIRAFKKLYTFVKKNRITVIHAHSTSFFLACVLKLRIWSLKIIWHEHYGSRIAKTAKDFKALYVCSYFFSGIIAVTEELKLWCDSQLHTKFVKYLPNFVTINTAIPDLEKRDNTIVCLANLRTPKNHLTLLQAFLIFRKKFPHWNLLLLGNDFEDSYSAEVKRFISENKLEAVVSIRSGVSDVYPVLYKAKIGVISSDVEGLPMALLEYGAAGMAPVVTNVGQCADVVSTYGIVVAPRSPTSFVDAFNKLANQEEFRASIAQDFHSRIKNHYSNHFILPLLLDVYKKN